MSRKVVENYFSILEDLLIGNFTILILVLSLTLVEIKSSTRVNRKDFRGLKEFKKDYPMAELYYLYQGKLEEEHGDIKVLPMLQFLKDFRNI